MEFGSVLINLDILFLIGCSAVDRKTHSLSSSNIYNLTLLRCISFFLKAILWILSGFYFENSSFCKTVVILILVFIITIFCVMLKAKCCVHVTGITQCKWNRLVSFHGGSEDRWYHSPVCLSAERNSPRAQGSIRRALLERHTCEASKRPGDRCHALRT